VFDADWASNVSPIYNLDAIWRSRKRCDYDISAACRVSGLADFRIETRQSLIRQTGRVQIEVSAKACFANWNLEHIDGFPLESAGGAMARVWNGPVFILAALYFVVDGVFSYVTQPITVWIAEIKLFERVRRWILSLGPYASLALFAVPVIILEPAKPLAGYLIATGHFFAGAVTFITAEVLKLTLVERLFQLNREKLLSIRAFAWGYEYWRHIMDVIESLEVWRASRRLAADAGRLLRSRLIHYRTRWTQYKRSRRVPRFPKHRRTWG
jgi:hypothetical protein